MAPDEFVETILSSPFVDDELYRQSLGGERSDIETARLYLRLPVRARPRISSFVDPTYYLEMNRDVADVDGDSLIHFIKHGCLESRSPHPLIDIQHIRSIDSYLLPERCSISDLCDVLRYDLANPSPYFLIDHYRSQVPDNSPVISGLLHHFLNVGLTSGLRPNPLFDPLWYYRQLDGVRDVWDGIRHFVTIGDRAGCASCKEFSGKRYLERYVDVSAAGHPPLAHYLTTGIAEGRACVPEQDASSPQSVVLKMRAEAAQETVSEAASIALYRASRERISVRRQNEKNNVLVSPLNILRFDCLSDKLKSLALPRFESPKVSILIPVYNEFSYTLECIASIVRSNPVTDFEVVIADDASPDEEVKTLQSIPNILYIGQPTNLGFLRNCNQSFRVCRGEYVLLLNNDAQLTPGALDAMVDVLDKNSDVAAVGPKILYPNGRLQEAGCTLDRDGIATMVGLFADPGKSAFNYDRDVHYCSGAALLVRRSEIAEQLFDELFVPAYCEDADLCLGFLAKGRRVVYCHKAEVVHHLSVSTNKQSATRRLQLVARNQQKLTEKWAALLEDINKVRPIAFYLPQYHPTEENDFYWGRGFTEWTNVTKATPAYIGHYQPHLPADLGFYDLRVEQTMAQQAALARRYGIAGFCVYYYNFGRRRALDQPFEAMVADSAIDFPYCVCWANENWTRHWDGGARELIFEQKYDHATLLAVIHDAARYAADPRYIRVNGKPLFLVYRPLLIPDTRGFTNLCRTFFREAGFKGVHLVYVESMEATLELPPPADLGFDACVEFPPQGLAVRLDEPAALVTKEGFVGVRYDYEKTIVESVSRPSVGHKRYPSVFPSWDNTPRQPLRGDSFVNSTPETFQIYVEEKLDEVSRQFVGDERLLFVNAWNEWAEGTYLEPDQKYGHRWLEAIRNALLAKSLA